ncbi:MAG: molybdopterin synthase sulfur carrier subunit [Ponticaulis sp.]|nr:molybdopterin synthase sulfur carrier subunit [Ponticaulis sp.]
MLELLYFGKLGDVTGKTSEQIELPPSVPDLNSLRQWIDERFEADGIFLEPTVRIAVDNEIKSNDFKISNAREIAFLPPVGGG